MQQSNTQLAQETKQFEESSRSQHLADERRKNISQYESTRAEFDSLIQAIVEESTEHKDLIDWPSINRALAQTMIHTRKLKLLGDLIW